MTQNAEQHEYETPEVLDLGAAETLTEANPFKIYPENFGEYFKAGP